MPWTSRSTRLSEVLANVRIEGAERAAHDRGVRNDVWRLAGDQRADRADGRFDRVDLAGDDRLQRGHDLGADRDRVDGQIGCAPCPPLPLIVT